jgi:gamma-glutamyl-gamma-aminobutyrate hydrolase PuuD
MSKKVLVVNGDYYANALKGVSEVKDFVFNINTFMKNPEEFKLVMFTGGADVSPSLYNHTSPKGMCGTNAARDAEEVSIFEVALEEGIPMTGICRGSQLLNVLCGGEMIHHLDNHGIGGQHTMLSNAIAEEFKVTSTHHQMSIPGKKGHIVGWSSPKRATVYIGNEDKAVNYTGPEVEAVYYPTYKVFAVQYHPEYMEHDSTGYKFYNQGVKDLLVLSVEEFTKKYVSSKVLNV